MANSVLDGVHAHQANLIRRLKKRGKSERKLAEKLEKCSDGDPCGLDECQVCSPLRSLTDTSVNMTKSPPVVPGSDSQSPRTVAGRSVPALGLLSVVPEDAANDVRLAEATLAEGVTKLKETAAHIAAAHLKGAKQYQIAEALNMSQPWVSRMLKWHNEGCPETPFGVQSKQKRLIEKQLSGEYAATNNSPAAAGSMDKEAVILSSEEQRLADELIHRLQETTEKVRRYVLDHMGKVLQ